jgi:hypothetical protein
MGAGANMITLRAADAGGWALVEADGEQWLVRPPYTLETRARLTLVQVQRAIESEDFVPESREFDGWASLCSELGRRRVAAATPEEVAAAADAAERLLARATPKQVRADLGRLEEPLKQGKAKQVRRTVLALLRSDAVRADTELTLKLLDLCRRCDFSGRSALGAENGQESWTVDDEEKVAAMVEATSQRGGIVRPAA